MSDSAVSPPRPLGTEGSLPLFFASHDGHTRKIALYLAERLQEKGIATQVRDLDRAFPSIDDMASPGPLILMAAIRYGFHLPAARRFIRAFYPRLRQGPLVMVSINLTARKPEKRTKETNLYLKKWLARTRLSPCLAMALAGELNYPRYRPFDRMMIRFIMTLTGGPTDPATHIVYTPWDEVDRLAAQIADLQITSSSAH